MATTRLADVPRERTSEPKTVSMARLANLQRAARYPWLDDGRCAVREASGQWSVLIERCYDVLDLSRIRFQDLRHSCSVATVDAITAEEMMTLCLLAQPELAVGAVIVLGTLVVAAAIAAELGNTKAPPDERCRHIAAGCREQCSETALPTKTGDGFGFWKCVNACLQKNGCTPGMY